MRSKVVTLRIDLKTYERLLKEAEKERISISALIKRAVDSYLSERDEVHLRDVEVLRRLNDLERKYLILSNRLNIVEDKLVRGD